MLTRFKTTLAELQECVERIRRNDESVAALGEMQSALARDIAAIAGQSKRMRSSLDALAKSSDVQALVLAGYGPQLEALSGEVGEAIPASISALAERLDGIKAQFNVAESVADQRFADARQNLALAESHILGAVGLMAQEMNATHNVVLASAGTQQGLSSALEQVLQRMDRLELCLADLGTNITQLPATISAERDRALDTIVERVLAKLGTLPATISAERDKALDSIAERVLSGLGTLPATIAAGHDKALDSIAERVLSGLGTLPATIAAGHDKALDSIAERVLSGLGTLPATIAAERDKALNVTAQQIIGDLASLPARVFSDGSAALDAGLQRVIGGLAQSESRTLGHLGRMANEVNAALNIVAAQQGAQASTDAAVTRIEARIAADNDRAIALNLLVGRGMASLVRRAPASEKAALPREVPTVEAQIQTLKKAAPNNFAHWHKAYRAGVIEGQRSVEGNLSHEGHVGAGYFRMFVNVHAEGRLLDFGCGPLALPSYLADWPHEQLAGFDPQPPFEPHPFAFTTSLGETVPWPDASFETVVIATSLDHVYLLDRALAEVKRVLVPGGRLLIWTAIFPQTPEYDPYGPKITPPDEYHLFHPGRNWFYSLFSADYELVERIETVAQAEMLAYRLKRN